MRKLLLVAAILCSSYILSTYGVKKQRAEKCGDYKPTSKACYAMQSAGDEGLCKKSWLYVFTQVCSFSCSGIGEIIEENCHICNHNLKEFPNCDDLMCERINTETENNQTSIYTTQPNEHFSSTTPDMPSTSFEPTQQPEVIDQKKNKTISRKNISLK